jgi:hypothetical protein
LNYKFAIGPSLNNSWPAIAKRIAGNAVYGPLCDRSNSGGSEGMLYQWYLGRSVIAADPEVPALITDGTS